MNTFSLWLRVISTLSLNKWGWQHRPWIMAETGWHWVPALFQFSQPTSRSTDLALKAWIVMSSARFLDKNNFERNERCEKVQQVLVQIPQEKEGSERGENESSWVKDTCISMRIRQDYEASSKRTLRRKNRNAALWPLWEQNEGVAPELWII